MIRIGVIGTGRLGGFHAEKAAADPRCSLVGVFDPAAANRERVAQKLGVTAFDDLEALLGGIDAAIIAAPTFSHGEIGRKVLEEKKHLLIEKPLCCGAADATALVDLADRNRLVLACGHVEQFNPAWRAARGELQKAIQSGPVLIDAVRTSGYTFRCADVGAVLDLMIHDLELVISLFSARELLSAPMIAWGTSEFGGHEDTASAQFLLTDGSVIRLFASRVELQAQRHLTLRSRTGRFTVNFKAPSFRVTTPDSAVVNGLYSPEKCDYAPLVPRAADLMKENYRTVEMPFPPQDALSSELDDFLHSIQEGNQPVVPGRRAAEAVQLAERIIAGIKVSRS